MNASARRKPLIAIVMSHANIARLAPGIQRFLNGQRGYCSVDFNRSGSDIRELLQQWKPAGVITQWDPHKSPYIMDLGFPTVLSTSDVEVPGAGRVDVDDEAVGRMAAEHLVATGLRAFGFLGNSSHYSEQRIDGFRRHLRSLQLGCVGRVHQGAIKRQAVEHWEDFDADMLNWLKDLPKPVGIFAVHDPLGRCLVDACNAAEIRVPDEVAIVAADNDEFLCGLAQPPMSSVRIPWSKIGFESARMMEEIIESGKVPEKPVLIEPEAVECRISSDLFAVEHPRLKEALHVIRKRACDGLSVKELMDLVPMSRRNLEQEFARKLSRTPRDEIIRVRLNAAKNLLSRSELSMPDIAERCGFGSAERLSVVFRKEEGLPPTRYRERYRLRPGHSRRDA